jgi:hypothetical protein
MTLLSESCAPVWYRAACMDEHDWIAQPRIDPNRAPFTETIAFRRYGLRDDPAPASPESLYLKAVIQEQGFDGPPHLVTRRELDRYVTTGEAELFRGVSDARFADALRDGEFFVGRGGEMEGMYTATGPYALAVARQYAAVGDGTVVRMSLKRGARVIAWRDLEVLEVVERERLTAVPPEIVRTMYNEFGRLAAYLGYDAVRIVEYPDADYYVVLNRTAIRVQKENVR